MNVFVVFPVLMMSEGKFPTGTLKSLILSFKRLWCVWLRIHSNLRSTIYCQAVAHGGRREWEFAWKKYQTSVDTSEKDQLLLALSCTKEIWLLNRWSPAPTKIKKGSKRLFVVDDCTALVGARTRSLGRRTRWPQGQNPRVGVSAASTSLTTRPRRERRGVFARVEHMQSQCKEVTSLARVARRVGRSGWSIWTRAKDALTPGAVSAEITVVRRPVTVSRTESQTGLTSASWPGEEGVILSNCTQCWPTAGAPWGHISWVAPKAY